VAITLGQQISKGEKLFVVHSKESKSLGNTVDKLDSMFHFNGEIQINAPGNGFILQFTYRDGDYVQDGEVLATIGDSKSLVFLLELPYELLPFLSLNKTVLLTLPDGKQLKGHVTNSLPSMDAQSQTQSYIIRIDHSGQIPENLVAKVQFVKKLSSNAMILPKAALLTDEKLLYSA
jgi:multidrug efflux pump subunit AcrA (membrane-fusion protein)